MEKALQKFKIAITGGIGSGKSKATQIIEALGFPTFSCDEIYKEVIISAEYVEKIEKCFPECVVNHEVDRKKLAQIIFNNEAQQKKLNQIAHPFIMKKLFDKMNRRRENLVFAEVPLLFEGKYEDDFDFVLIIQRDTPKRIVSIKERDGLSDEEIAKRMQSQIDYDTLTMANVFKKENYFIIENNTTIEDLKKNLYMVLSIIKNRVL